MGIAALLERVTREDLGTLMWALRICASLFALMVAMFTRPALVIDPGAAQLGALGLVLVAGVSVTFGLLARFSERRAYDLAARLGVWASALASVAVGAFVVWWWLRDRREHGAV